VPYLIIATLVLATLLLFGARPAEITPPYWVFMGATAISVLAGAQILRLPADPLTVAARPVIAGLSVPVCAALHMPAARCTSRVPPVDLPCTWEAVPGVTVLRAEALAPC